MELSTTLSQSEKDGREDSFHATAAVVVVGSQVMMGAFDSAKTLLSCSSSSPKMKMAEALDCFFVDYDMVPLLVQENYLEAIRQGTQRAGTKTDVAEMRGLEAAAAASSSLCRVDEATNLLRRVRK